MNGVKQGWADYVTAAQNNMQAAQRIFGDVTNGLADEWTQFCMTGKASFSDLTKAVLTDLSKIAAEKAIVGIGSAIADSSWGQSAASLFHFADGGRVSGAGSGTSDSIPAMLSNGEYVLKADTVSKIGVPVLDAINNGRAVHSAAHYASGGLVGSAVAGVNAGGSGGGSNVAVTVNSGGGLDQGDAPWLEKAVKQLVDGRIAQKMSGQGGYMWRQKTGSV